MRISFTTCWHFHPAVLHGRIRRIFWWVALLVTKSELATCQRKRPCRVHSTSLKNPGRSSTLVTFAFLHHTIVTPPPLCLCFVALSLNGNDYGRKIYWQNISMPNPHSFTAPDLLCRGSLHLCSFDVTVFGEPERRKGSKDGGEINISTNQNQKSLKSEQYPFLLRKFPVSSQYFWFDISHETKLLWFVLW